MSNMNRLNKVIIEDGYPSFMLVVAASLIILFVETSIIRFILSPFLLLAGVFFQRKLRPSWFLRPINYYFYGLGFFLLVSGMVYIVSYLQKDLSRLLFIFWLILFCVFLLIVDHLADEG